MIADKTTTTTAATATATPNEQTPVAGRRDLFDSGIPREIIVRLEVPAIDETQSCDASGGSELDRATLSSVGYDSARSEQSKGDLGSGIVLGVAVESMYQDLEVDHPDFLPPLKNKNNIDRNPSNNTWSNNDATTYFLPSSMSVSVTDRWASFSRDDSVDTGCSDIENEEELRLLLATERRFTPIANDENNTDDGLSVKATSPPGEAPDTVSVASKTCSPHARKRWKKRKSRTNLRTRVERMQHQLEKPFRTASRLVLWSTERLCQAPDLQRLYCVNPSLLLSRGNKSRLLLGDSNEDDDYGYGYGDAVSVPDLNSIPNIVSLDSSDMESHEVRSASASANESREMVGNEDRETVAKRGMGSSAKGEIFDPEDLRFIYSRQVLPVPD